MRGCGLPKASPDCQLLQGKVHLLQAPYQHRSVWFQAGIQTDKGGGQLTGMIQACAPVATASLTTQ
ncbi:hypothetical protein DSLASN_08180 [Desulfoluna limicola]|uniref:Uncharacterized protein n=1 Tax=Desulfoluna limicola TaxID=2810562 RepID=A0ABM7PDB1_9BACT|nr:hypothetical protein DSLASN_08180 [Desulfoluna limicola]